MMTAPPIFVEGFQRCGSSLTMQMLNATGIPTISEYPTYEDERAGLNPARNQFLSGLSNIAVKVLEPMAVPVSVPSAMIIWLDRHPGEQAKSASKFMAAVAGLPRLNRHGLRKMEALYRGTRAQSLIDGQTDRHPTLFLRFEDLVETPRMTAKKIEHFLKPHYPMCDAEKMAAQVRPRGEYGGRCLPYLLELELMPVEIAVGGSKGNQSDEIWMVGGTKPPVS